DYRFYDRVILAITSPIQTAISWTLEQTVDLYQGYLYLWNVKTQNTRLFEENRKLLGQIASLKEAQNENSRLRELLNFQEKMKLETIVARVIAKDVSTEFRAIRLNRGEDAGIKKGMAVITYEGVVGRVMRTTASTADVVTILDLLSAVDTIIERSRARGVVEGLTDELCQLKFTLRVDDIQVGDLLLSSGLGGVYPRGVAVGTVSRVKKKPFGITQDVEVKPTVDFTKLEEVMIVTDQRVEVLERERAAAEARKALEKEREKEKEKADKAAAAAGAAPAPEPSKAPKKRKANPNA
ncbi:MAG: rod shape-determining protein MreC, partial [Bdellovibrionales bacterium]|nr:rod shape-determining protein MreC [Bdellovibrionales bacterium]